MHHVQRSNLVPLIVALAAALAACTAASGVRVEDAWARPAGLGENSAVYFTIYQRRPMADTLLRAATEVTDTVEIHRTVRLREAEMAATDEAGTGEDMDGMPMDEPDVMGSEMDMEPGVMRMVRQDSVAVPPLGSVAFEPGGLHLMLVAVKQDLNEGDLIELSLTFEKAGEILLRVPVEVR